MAADEPGDEGRAGALEDFARGAGLADVARLHHHDQIGQRHRLVLAVGDVNETDAEIALQPLQFAAHMLAQERIERRQRLVEQQHFWPRNQRARQRHALLLAARHLRGQPLGIFTHPHQIQKLARLLPPRRFGDAAHLEAVGDIVDGAHMREQRVILEHHRRAALGGRRVGHVAVADQDIARGGRLVAGDHPQRRRLAATAGTEQTAIAGFGNAQRDAVHGRCALIDLGDGDHFEIIALRRRRFRRSCSRSAR